MCGCVCVCVCVWMYGCVWMGAGVKITVEQLSIMVIGPGDEPKHLPAYISPEEVDIEQ